MKEVVILVGPPGAGKTTYCKKQLPDHFRVSQDEMGQYEHLNIYLEALRRGKEKIVIDRMNFTREQRKNYLGFAKEHGYSTRIITRHVPFGICYGRLIERENHPTLNKDNLKGIDGALSMFFDKYEYVLDSEADVVERSFYDPYMLDLSKAFKDQRKIVIGDVHGCFDEFLALLARCDYRPGEDVILLAGDLIDRGPKVKELLNFLRDGWNIFTVQSNHENKFIRYLRGRQVRVAHGMKKTLEQLDDVLRDDESKQQLRFWLEANPYVIKFDTDKYLVHAGINPKYPIERQNRETLIYARSYDPETGNMTNPAETRKWWEFPGPKDTKIYFGHQVYDKPNVSDWAVSLDGGCVAGGVLRGAVIMPYSYEEIAEVQGKNYKTDKDDENTYHQKLAPFEALTEMKFLTKSEKDDMVLYSYTDKCTFEKVWTEYTRAARGIVFNRFTGELLARPFDKFFNLGEMEETFYDNLPKHEKVVATEKMDGSMLTVFWNNGKIEVATKGSFFSDQAAMGAQILEERIKGKHDLFRGLSDGLTLIFEVIYPENKIVIDYDGLEDIVLTAARVTTTGQYIPYTDMEATFSGLFTIVKRHYYTLDEMVDMQKTLPFYKEGFVVEYEGGFRVKIKGEEYLRIHRAIANATPLNVWRNMTYGYLPFDFLKQIPDEVMPELQAYESILRDRYMKLKVEMHEHVKTILDMFDKNAPDYKKQLGNYLKKHPNLEYAGFVFPVLLDRRDVVEKKLMERIEPKGNQL